MEGTKYVLCLVFKLTAIKLLMLTALLKTQQSVSFDRFHPIMHRKLHSADHTFWFCGPLKFSKSDTCINLMRSSTRHRWKARLPNPDRTYHFSIWLTASAASLSFLLSSEFNRKFSFPHVQHLTAHGLWKLDCQVINVLKLVLQHVLFFFLFFLILIASLNF